MLATKDGAFFVARASDCKVLVAEAGQPPAEWSFEQLDRVWSAEIILVTKRELLGAGVLRFNLNWF